MFIESLEDLKKSEGYDVQVWGSSEHIQLLLKNDLVDEFRLKIYLLTLDTGKKLFDDGTILVAFALTESLATPTTNELKKLREVLLKLLSC
jgi:dihydrofolate reductase